MTESKCNSCGNKLILDEENICAQCELRNDNGENMETIQNVNCGSCNIIVEENSEGLYCDVCNKWYHNACCEKPLMEYLYCLLNEAPNNIKWFCDKCIWETEKWIKSFNSGNRVDKESKNATEKDDTVLLNRDSEFINNQVRNNTVTQEIKNLKRGRPRRLNTVEGNCKTTNIENDYSKDPEFKREMEDDMSFGFDDSQSQSTDSEDYDETILTKKKRRVSKNKQKRCNQRHFCDLCPKGFLKQENLIAHKLTHSGDKKPFKCTICDSSFVRKSQLKPHHLAAHSDDKQFICEICAKSFKWKSALIRHLQEIHSDNKPYQCSVCDYKAAKKSNIDAHMLKHSNDKPFKCTECESSFKTPYTLKQHMVTHSSVKPFSCEECGKSFTTANGLKTHTYTHTGEWPFNCTKCDAKFAEKIRLVIHMRIHTGERPYACTICEYKAVQKSALKRHLQAHSGVKPFVCDICGKQVSDAQSLKLHALTHTGEKPLKCDICGKHFRAPGALRVHMMYHNKTRKHFCPQCGYGSITPGELKKHIQTVHSNETPYECDMCGNKYKTRGNLSKHKRGVRGACHGVNGGNFSKHTKLPKNLLNEPKPEIKTFSDQKPDAIRFTLKPLSEQSQSKHTYKGITEHSIFKTKDTMNQYPYQEQTSSLHTFVSSSSQSYQNTTSPHLYSGVQNNNPEYNEILIHPSTNIV